MEIEKLIEALGDLEMCAYGYHINGEVLGMDCTDFECLMADAAEEISKIPALQAENDRLKRERDAALKSFPYMCNSCRYHTMFYNGYAPVYGCTNPDGHCLNNYDKWQWRGPKEE